MKRKNIKNATIGIISSCILIYIFLNLFPYLKASKQEQIPIVKTSTDIQWSDTISNKASDCTSLSNMDREIERFMERWELRGMQIAISRNNSLLYTKGYGFADKEKNKPMEANSIMRIASSSKLITATAIMKLLENNKLKLSDKVFGKTGLLNDDRYTNAIEDIRIYDITVEDLLLHRGGFTLRAGDPMFNTHEIIKARNLAKAPTNEELIEIVLGRRLGFQPGSGHRYSNFGYMVLSKIIEKISGISYWDYVINNIMLPSGITGIKPATNYYEDRLPREAKYYSPDNELIEEYNGSGKMVNRCYGGANIHGLMGAGGWLASAADLSRFIASIDGDNKLKDIISANSVRRMTAYAEKENVCIGWTKVDSKGNWLRSGTLSSAHSLIQRFPNGECWVITMNTGVWRGYHFTGEMIRLIDRLRSKYASSLPRHNLF